MSAAVIKERTIRQIIDRVEREIRVTNGCSFPESTPQLWQDSSKLVAELFGVFQTSDDLQLAVADHAVAKRKLRDQPSWARVQASVDAALASGDSEAKGRFTWLCDWALEALADPSKVSAPRKYRNTQSACRVANPPATAR